MIPATLVPRSLLTRAARQQVASVDFITSNVRAAFDELLSLG